MAEKIDFLKASALKGYIKGRKLRSSADAIAAIEKGFNEVIARVIVEAGKLARAAKVRTVMPEHVAEAFAKHVGKTDLDWEEILAQVLDETPADLGKISKGVRDYIERGGTS